jgi:hypothetical protein
VDEERTDFGPVSGRVTVLAAIHTRKTRRMQKKSVFCLGAKTARRKGLENQGLGAIFSDMNIGSAI